MVITEMVMVIIMVIVTTIVEIGVVDMLSGQSKNIQY